MIDRRSNPRPHPTDTSDDAVALRFWRDNNGNVVIAQRPNLLLLLWLVSTVATRFIAVGRIKTGLGATAGALLFAWAYLETTRGVNYFRRLLGVIVLLVAVTGFFTR